MVKYKPLITNICELLQFIEIFPSIRFKSLLKFAVFFDSFVKWNNNRIFFFIIHCFSTNCFFFFFFTNENLYNRHSKLLAFASFTINFEKNYDKFIYQNYSIFQYVTTQLKRIFKNFIFSTIFPDNRFINHRSFINRLDLLKIDDLTLLIDLSLYPFFP